MLYAGGDVMNAFELNTDYVDHDIDKWYNYCYVQLATVARRQCRIRDSW